MGAPGVPLSRMRLTARTKGPLLCPVWPRLPEQWRSPTTVEPLDQLAAPGAARVLGIFGGVDHWTPPDDIDAIRRLPNVEAVVYADADHGFVHDPSRPAHRADDARDAWSRALRFLSD